MKTKLEKLKERREELWADFEAQGGRGVELADEIDEIDAKIGKLEASPLDTFIKKVEKKKR